MSLPKLDPDLKAEDLRECGAKFLAAGFEYWKMMNKIKGMGGAIAWVSDTDGFTVIFTRGEYHDTLMQNIHRLGPIHHFGVGAIE